MYFFDYIEERDLNGTFEIFAINEQENQAYLLREVIVSTSESQLNGFSLSISCYPEKYIYRGKFNKATEMEDFKNNILRLLREANIKNYGILSINE
jgi:hypothetical protein